MTCVTCVDETRIHIHYLFLVSVQLLLLTQITSQKCMHNSYLLLINGQIKSNFSRIIIYSASSIAMHFTHVHM